MVSGYIKWVSLNNRLCQARPALIDINSNEPFYYPFNVSDNKCSESGDIIDDPFAQTCVPDNVKLLKYKF